MRYFFFNVRLGFFFLLLRPTGVQWLLEILTLSGFYSYMGKLGSMSPRDLYSVKLIEEFYLYLYLTFCDLFRSSHRVSASCLKALHLVVCISFCSHCPFTGVVLEGRAGDESVTQPPPSENQVYLGWWAVVFAEWKGMDALSWGGVEVVSFIILNTDEYLQGMIKPTPLHNCYYLQYSYFPTGVTGNTFNTATTFLAWPKIFSGENLVVQDSSSV